MQAYRRVLRKREVRRVLALSMCMRIPMWAGAVVLTLHVVSHLHRSYGAAGLVASASTVALAISGPWRGRRLDTQGLRRAIAPSLVVLAGCWSVAPFVGYWPLLALASLAGLFTVPSFSIVRQALLHSVPAEDHKTALALDAVTIELSFMIGPAVGVLLATGTNTVWALMASELTSVAACCLMWLANPRLRGAAVSRPTGSRWALFSPRLAAVLAVAMACTVVLTGTDIGIVAALRSEHHQSSIGWVLAVWGLGSAIGGFSYGAIRPNVSVGVLLGLLSLATVPVALATNAVVLAVLLFLAGLLCAPAITATVEAVSKQVHEQLRGEAMGWHGSALTVGSAIGAPVAGVAVDLFGWQAAFLATALFGAAAAVIAIAAGPGSDVQTKTTVGLIRG